MRPSSQMVRIANVHRLIDLPVLNKAYLAGLSAARHKERDRAWMESVYGTSSPQEIIKLYLPFLRRAGVFADISTPLRVAAFLAQIDVESGSLARTEENLGKYTAENLEKVFKKYYMEVAGTHNMKGKDGKTKKVKDFKEKMITKQVPTSNRSPETEKFPLSRVEAGDSRAVGNRVYGGRMGNDTANDGFTYRGRGLLQITGKDMYYGIYNKYISCYNNAMDLKHFIEWCVGIEGAAVSAGFVWDIKKSNFHLDHGGIEKVSHQINGGANGAGKRSLKFDILYQYLIRREREWSKMNGEKLSFVGARSIFLEAGHGER